MVQNETGETSGDGNDMMYTVTLKWSTWKWKMINKANQMKSLKKTWNEMNFKCLLNSELLHGRNWNNDKQHTACVAACYNL